MMDGHCYYCYYLKKIEKMILVDAEFVVVAMGCLHFDYLDCLRMAAVPKNAENQIGVEVVMRFHGLYRLQVLMAQCLHFENFENYRFEMMTFVCHHRHRLI